MRTLTLGPVAVRFAPRVAAVTAVLALCALLVGFVALLTGDLPLSPDAVGRALLGQDAGFAGTVVREWRLPRVTAALLLGAAMGASGAIFQSLTRNPLGSPDVIGFGTGAYTGALIVLLMLGGGYLAASGGALVGGLVAALLTYRLARAGVTTGLRLIIVGIAISSVLGAVNHWMLLTADLETAMAAATWGAGTLNGTRWTMAAPSCVLAVCLLLTTLGSSRPLHLLEMGDDAATALGLAVERWRVTLLILGVALTAVATVVTGPVAFVALCAPQLARRLSRAPGADLPGSAAMGALLLAAADLVAQRAFAPTQLPVGIVTGVLGGVYLLWLLTKEARPR